MLEDSVKQGTAMRNASLIRLLATEYVAASFPFSKSLMQYVSAELILLLRFLISTEFFYIFIRLKKLSVPIMPMQWKAYMFVSFFYPLFFASTFEALKLTSAFNTSFIHTLIPIISLLISWIILRNTNLIKYIFLLIISTLLSFIPAAVLELSFSILFCTVLTFFSVQYAEKIINLIKISSFHYLTPVFYLINNIVFSTIEIGYLIILSCLISEFSLLYIQWVSDGKKSINSTQGSYYAV